MHQVSDTGRRERAMMTIAALAGTAMLAFSAILIGGSLPSPGPWGARGEVEPPTPAERTTQTHAASSTPRASERPFARQEAPEPIATHPSRSSASAEPTPVRAEPRRSPGLVAPDTPSEDPEMPAAARPPAPGLIEATSTTPEPPRRTRKPPKKPKKRLQQGTELKDVAEPGGERSDGS